jgi:hypothetical protein
MEVPPAPSRRPAIAASRPVRDAETQALTSPLRQRAEQRAWKGRQMDDPPCSRGRDRPALARRRGGLAGEADVGLSVSADLWLVGRETTLPQCLRSAIHSQTG